MIPSVERIVAGHAFVARRYNVRVPPDVTLITAAVEEATGLAGRAEDEPAALLFALARRPGAFPGVRAVVTDLLVLEHVRALGFTLTGGAASLRPLHVPIEKGELQWTELRDWFVARMIATPTPDPSR